MKRQWIGIIYMEVDTYASIACACHGIHTGKRGQFGRHRLSQIRINNRYVRGCCAASGYLTPLLQSVSC